MQRRDFILKSGQVFTAAIVLSQIGQTNLLAASIDEISNLNKKEGDKRPNLDHLKQPILKAIALGVNAPSPHNTQSWKFKIINDTEMLFYVDEKILLMATDPTTRQIHIGAGCFIETLAIGTTSFGYTSKVTYFPEGYEGFADIGIKPIAKITLLKSAIESHSLAPFIYTRQTNRSAFIGDLITEKEYNKIKTSARSLSSKMQFIDNLETMETCKDLFYKAFEIESKTYRTNEETRLMFRYSEDERAEKRDGISIPQMGFKGLMKRIAENSLDNGNKEKWHSEKSIAISLKTIQKGIESSKGFIVWKTASNTFIDWVKTGQDYVSMSLAATAEGLYFHPYNQIIQEYDEMKIVRDEFNALLSIKKEEKIQMIVRIGRAKQVYYSYRRDVTNYLIK